MEFEFATAGRIVFGPGAVARLSDLVLPLGRRVLLVGGSTPARWSAQAAALEERGIETTPFGVAGEPTTRDAREGTKRAREAGCEVVVAVGGGSAIDVGKAVAALLANGGDPLDYLEVIGAGRKLTKPSAPCVAVPTTAGTGSEVTRNAVLLSEEHRVKVSLRSPGMLPTVALVDPELTHDMPPPVTASTGLDALTQVLEPFVSHQANPLTDALCREGLRRGARSLRRAFRHAHDARARSDMALVSLLGGLALANAKLGAVHGFAGPLGGMFQAPHGAICARLLPFVMEANVSALSVRQPDSPALRRYEEVARLLTGRADARVADGVAWVEETSRALDIPPLRAHGVEERDLGPLVEKSEVSSSMQGNPIRLTRKELRRILERALGD